MWVFVFNSFYIAWSGGTFVADWSVKTPYIYTIFFIKNKYAYMYFMLQY